jgi:hypothetical protein
MPGPAAARTILTEAKAIMSSVSFIFRHSQDASDGWDEFVGSLPIHGRTDERLRRDAFAEDRALASSLVAHRTLDSRERAGTFTTARHVLDTTVLFSLRRNARVVAVQTCDVLREPAPFVEKNALAETCALGGIKHGTVRNESTPRVRAASILPITHSTGRQESSSRITPSRLALLSSMSMCSTAQPSRSDRFSDGCRTSEDQGGPQ